MAAMIEGVAVEALDEIVGNGLPAKSVESIGMGQNEVRTDAAKIVGGNFDSVRGGNFHRLDLTVHDSPGVRLPGLLGKSCWQTVLNCPCVGVGAPQ